MAEKGIFQERTWVNPCCFFWDQASSQLERKRSSDVFKNNTLSLTPSFVLISEALNRLSLDACGIERV